MVRIVVAYIERYPQRMHENFKRLALEAMREAWPGCAPARDPRGDEVSPRFCWGRLYRLSLMLRPGDSSIIAQSDAGGVTGCDGKRSTNECGDRKT